MVVRLLVLLSLAGCGLEPLSREQLFGVPGVVPKVRLTGTISDAKTGAPMVGVSVNVASASTTSDDTGSFSVEELATGEFDGSALKSGYARKDFRVTLAAGTNRLNLTLSPIECAACASLSGTVTSEQTGAPLAGAQVSIGPASVQTSAAGTFTLEGLMATEVDGVVVLAGHERKTFRTTLAPGANRLDVVMRPIPCGGCAMGLLCELTSMTCKAPARVSFNVVDDCTGAPLDARVAIQGKATCSNASRGFAEITGLVPGGPQTLAAGKDGYQAASVMVTLDPGFNSLPTIRMARVGGCTVTPATTPCVCNTPECQ